MSWRRQAPLPQSPPPRTSTPSTPGKGEADTERWGHRPQHTLSARPRKDPFIQAALSPKQDENEDIVLLLRDAAKQDHRHLSYAELEAEQAAAAAGLQALISVLQSHKRADPDLPFSGLQMMRLARSVKMFCGFPDIRSLAILAAEEMVAYAALTTVMHNTRFAVWSGLLLGLAGTYAEHASTPPPKLILLADMAVQELSSSTEQWVFAPGQAARTVSQFLWALAKLGFDASRMTGFMDTLEREACSEPGRQTFLQGANAQDLAMLVWSLARLMPASARCMGLWSGALDGLSGIIQSVQPHFKTQDLSNSVWGLASAVNEGLEPPKNSHLFLGAIAEAVKSGAMERALPQEWSNLIWGMGRLKATTQASKGFLEVARRATSKLLPTVVPQAFSNSLWGLAALEAVGDSSAPDLAIKAMDLLTTRLDSFNPQDVGNSLWAITSLIPQSRCLTVDGSSYMLKPRDYEQHVMPMLEAVTSHVSNKDKMRGVTAQNWTNICWAFATLGVYIPEAFYTAIAGLLAIVRKSEMPPEKLNAILHPCVAVGHEEPDLHQLWGLARKACWNLPHAPPESIASTLYAWAALSASCGPNETPDATAVARSFFDAAANLRIEDLPEKSLGALALAHIEACDVKLPGGGLPDGVVRESALARWISRKASDQMTSSGFQTRVAEAAERAGARFTQLEAASCDQLHTVDIALFWPVPKHSEQLVTHIPEHQRLQTADGSYVMVSIECDGPFHFLAWPPGHVNGSTKIRDRQLARRYPVCVAICWTSWESVKGGGEAPLSEQTKKGATDISGLPGRWNGSSTRAEDAKSDEGISLRPGCGAAPAAGKPSSSPAQTREVDGSDASSTYASVSLRPGGVSGLRWGARSSAAQTPQSSPAKPGAGPSSSSAARTAPSAGSGAAVQCSLQKGQGFEASPSKGAKDVPALDSRAKWLAQALDHAVVQALSKPGSSIRL